MDKHALIIAVAAVIAVLLAAAFSIAVADDGRCQQYAEARMEASQQVVRRHLAFHQRMDTHEGTELLRPELNALIQTVLHHAMVLGMLQAACGDVEDVKTIYDDQPLLALALTQGQERVTSALSRTLYVTQRNLYRERLARLNAMRKR